MIGAGKLTVETVKEIKDLFKTNLSDTEIASMYGVSRPMVNLIRNGQRWPEEREKIKAQVDEVEELPCLCEEIIVTRKIKYNIMTRVCPIISPHGKLYIILHYLQDRLTSERFSGLFEEIPDDSEVQVNHDKFKSKIW
jgi:predicted transcriptional regulator